MALKQIKSLEDFNQGAAKEQFERAWREILDNISNPATKSTATRTLTLTVQIKPSADRSMAETVVKVVNRLAPIQEDVGSFIFDLNEKGQVIAMTQEAQEQGDLFIDYEKTSKAN